MRAAPIVLSLSPSACASTSSNVYADQQEPLLPNSTMQTAQPLVPGEDDGRACVRAGGLVPDRVPRRSRDDDADLRQAQENALGATATLTVVAPNGQAMGS
ncbi:MAG: hypothetical protein R3A52_08685 [Polyangiales bacterium]